MVMASLAIACDCSGHVINKLVGTSHMMMIGEVGPGFFAFYKAGSKVKKNEQCLFCIGGERLGE